jgi:hypothetical protein
MKGFIILVTKTKRENCPKQMSTNYISINWEQLKKEDKVILVQTRNAGT